MKPFVVVIPARYASTRLPGKPLPVTVTGKVQKFIIRDEEIKTRGLMVQKTA